MQSKCDMLLVWLELVAFYAHSRPNFALTYVAAQGAGHWRAGPNVQLGSEESGPQSKSKLQGKKWPCLPAGRAIPQGH